MGMKMIKKRLWRCKKCQHEWANRKPYKPAVCPKCKNPRWSWSK